MGVDSRKAPPLPAPTETESLSTPTELATDVSRLQEEERSHISIPDDGTPVTIRTRGHKANRSQTSLLIEYFEGGKGPASPEGGASSTSRKPSVRVRLTPSKGGRGKNDHIQITEMSKSSRKASGSKRAHPDPLVPSRSELDMTESEDARSLHSYASATEESNVSRHPIEVEIVPSQSRRRERKPSSPLIPAADSKVSSSYVPPNMSDISAIPTDSFLDGSGGTTHLSYSPGKRHSKSPSRAEALAAGALGAVTAAAVTDKLNRKTRSSSHDRKIIEKAVEKATRPDKKHRSKSRTSSISELEVEGKGSSSRRRSSKGGHKESLVSAADSSLISSAMTPSQRSYDSYSSSKVSINNPKLLETVEDAIRRLILPELESLKRERSQRDGRRPKDRESLSSLTSVSREELSLTSKRISGGTEHSVRSRGREARNDLSPQSSTEHVSVLEHEDSTPKKDHHSDAALLGAAAAAGIAAASRDRSRADEKRQRRRRRARTPEHGRAAEEYDEFEQDVIPPMPLSSEINPSEMTRTSILSAETDRPHSASEELTPVREVARDVVSNDSIHETPTPTRSSEHTSLQRGLGTVHANISHGDLRDLPRRGHEEYDEYDDDSELSSRNPAYRDEYDDYEEEGLSEPAMYDNNFYSQQDVPPPLRYVPYQQERRGLSPIQSVSGYTENGSDIHQRRDSRLTESEVSSPRKSPRPNSIPSNMRSREFGDEESSVRSSGHYRDTRYTDDSELDHVTSGQAVRGVGANPQFIHQPFGAESNVASLVDGSMVDQSVLSAGQDYRDSQLSYDSRAEEHLSRGSSPAKNSVTSRVEEFEKRNSPALSKQSFSNASREFEEYELDQYGRKYAKTQDRHSPTNSEQAITNAALTRAAEEAKKKAQQAVLDSESQWQGAGITRDKSFKERAKADGFNANATPRHSVDRLSEAYTDPVLGANGLPDADYPMPEIGYGYQDEDGAHSVVQEQLGGSEAHEWHGEHTPTQEKTFDFDRALTPKASEKGSTHGIGLSEAVAAGALAAAAGMAATHSRQPSQEHDEEWHRTSMDRKRDTLVTNPYEGTSPIANLPGLEQLAGFNGDLYRTGYHTGSPGPNNGDEGYETAQPNEALAKGKAVDFQHQPGMGGNTDDPFYVSMPKHQRQLSGLSQGMASPLYDAATGTGIDRIQSKDIIALMEHLMVRDAQRSARDTELLVTLVRSATEMRTSFNDIKRLLADTEDQIIGEVKDNTEKTVQRHLGGPRPFPGSGSRSIQGGSQAGTLDETAKKRSIFRRALKGLSSKGTNDLGRIEDMLMQLLGEVDVLKHQTAGQTLVSNIGAHNQSLDHLPEIQYEQDKGYEPEGHAGTSTTSHASQSGPLSIPQSRGPSAKGGYERKFSDHRISTVPEDDEDNYDNQPYTPGHEYSNPNLLMSPALPPTRGGSVPLGTPPQTAGQLGNHPASHENTPQTDASRKHKSKGSSGFFPKISRWSETTTSSVGKMFRNSRKHDHPEEFFQHPPSRSGSELGDYDNYRPDGQYDDEKLHSGFSQQDLSSSPMPLEVITPTQFRNEPPLNVYGTPEDPKYKAHRNSINLQHPQPRPGQTERFRTALETSAQGYAGIQSPMSPRSDNWANSAVSLNRFPDQSNHYDEQNAANEYGWTSPAQQGPPRPPKEPLDEEAATPPRNERLSKVQKHSPLPYHSVDSGYGGTATHAGTVGTASYHSGSPKLENRNLSGALAVPARRPSGPRAMTPSRGMTRSRGSEDGESVRSGRSGISDTHARDERRRKRDTFGSVATAASQESETF